MPKGQFIAASVAALLFALGLQPVHAQDASSDKKPKTAKNVILFIGDGMGVSEVTAARYMEFGAAGRMNFDEFKFTGFQTTWSVKPGPGPRYTPDYAPDSASTATMWATGRKTIDERLSQGPSEAIEIPGKNYKTLLEIFQKQGKRVGDVSTAEITDATPAALVAKISLRGCQGPGNMTLCPKETKTAGGLGSVAEQLVDHQVDVVLGGGRARFDGTSGPIAGGPDDGKTVLESAERQGIKVIGTADELAALKPGKKPILGLFTSGNMTTEWSGPQAIPGEGVAPHKCGKNNRPSNEPSLSAMTKKAIELLEGGKDGFFLQVEGASIDKQDHAANACGQIGETVALDKAIGVALKFQEKNPDTLIVVTADHSHTSLVVADDYGGIQLPTGYTDNLITNEGGALRITYGTAGGPGPAATPPSQQHTGGVVPIWAQGPGAKAILGTTDHTDLFFILQGQ